MLENMIYALTMVLAIVLSIVLHELAHGYVAMWNGDYTAKVNGRLSLNPLKHFDLIGFLMLITVHFGYARPVPINPNNFRHRKLGMFFVSIAGVLLNFILAFVSFIFFMLCNLSPEYNLLIFTLRYFFNWMVVINLNLMLFNILPIYPLDGFRIIEGLTRSINPVTKFLRNYGQYILITLIGISIIVDIFHMPMYFDLIGMFISYGKDFILKGFYWFWGLFI